MMSDQAAHDPCPPIKEVASSPLTTLPIEIITSIVSHLDVLSAIRLSRVARPFVSLADDAVWRHLKLALPDNHAEGAEDREAGSDGSDGSEDEESGSEEGSGESGSEEGSGGEEGGSKASEAKEAEQQYQEALCARVQAIIARADESRWPLVQSVHLNPRLDAVSPMLDILDLVSPTLQTLRIEGPVAHTPDAEATPETCHPFQVRIMHSDFALPALLHVHLQSHIWQPSLILRLCQIAPNLTSLDVELHLYNQIECSKHPDRMFRGPYVRPLSPTKPRTIRFMLGAKAVVQDGLEDEEDRAMSAIEELLRVSPLLEQCTLVLRRGLESDVKKVTTDRLRDHGHLRDVCLGRRLSDITEPWRETQLQVSSLRRLVLEHESCLDIMPDLETLYLGPPSIIPPEYREPRSRPGNNHMLPYFARMLRKSAKLSTIHPAHLDPSTANLDLFSRLDQLEKCADLGRVRSMVHGKEELLHARLLLTFIRTEDTDNPYLTTMTAQPKHTEKKQVHDYVAWDETNRVRVFRRCAPTWQLFSDYDGLSVPARIIDEMLKEEGIADKDWTGRGLRVGDRAWRILTDWRHARVRNLEEGLIAMFEL